MNQKAPRSTSPPGDQPGGDDRPTTHSTSSVQPLLYTLADLAEALRISRRHAERLIAGGRLPKPDIRLGRAVRWRVGTIQAWLEAGGEI